MKLDKQSYLFTRIGEATLRIKKIKREKRKKSIKKEYMKMELMTMEI